MLFRSSDANGSNPVLLPPSRAAANTDEQLVEQRNNKDTFRTDTVVKPKEIKKEKPSGAKTSEAQQTETQRQEAADTVPVEQRDMYDEEVEFHNETNPERKLPVYKKLTPEQKATYFSKIKNNTLEEHGRAINDLADEFHGKPEEKKVEKAPVKDHVNKQVQKGNGNAFLNAVRTTSKNSIRKAVAQRIYEAGLNTKDRKSTRLNSSHIPLSRMPSSA